MLLLHYISSLALPGPVAASGSEIGLSGVALLSSLAPYRSRPFWGRPLSAPPWPRPWLLQWWQDRDQIVPVNAFSWEDFEHARAVAERTACFEDAFVSSAKELHRAVDSNGIELPGGLQAQGWLSCDEAADFLTAVPRSRPLAALFLPVGAGRL